MKTWSTLTSRLKKTTCRISRKLRSKRERSSISDSRTLPQLGPLVYWLKKMLVNSILDHHRKGTTTWLWHGSSMKTTSFILISKNLTKLQAPISDQSCRSVTKFMRVYRRLLKDTLHLVTDHWEKLPIIQNFKNAQTSMNWKSLLTMRNLMTTQGFHINSLSLRSTHNMLY